MTIVVVVLNYDDRATANTPECVQCVVCLASLDDEVHDVLDGVGHLDAHGQR